MPILPAAGVKVDPLEPLKRGDLYVRFDIKFPKKLTEEQRLRIENVLQTRLA